MSEFEFIMVLVSVIMGLGITAILDGTVSALRADTPTKPGLIHGLWVLALFLFSVQLWLLRWRVSTRPGWTLLEVLAFLYVPIVLFALAKLIFPAKGREVQLTTYLLENRRAFFGLWAALYVGFAFYPILFSEGAVTDASATYDPRIMLTFIPLFGLLAWSSNRKLHVVFGLLWVVLGVAGFFFQDAGFSG